MKPRHKDNSLMTIAYRARRQRAAWLGLYGCVAKFLKPHSPQEKASAEKRMAEYVKRLEELGVELTPEEEL